MITNFKIFEYWDPFQDGTFRDKYDWQTDLRDEVASNYRNYAIHTEQELHNLTKRLLKQLYIFNVDDFNSAISIVLSYVDNYIDNWKYNVIDLISDNLSEDDIFNTIINSYDLNEYDITKSEIRKYIQEEIKKKKISNFNL